MKRLFFLTLVFTCTFSLFAQKNKNTSKKQGDFTLKIALDKSISAKAYLSLYNGLELNRVDSVDINPSNAYVFKLTSSSPRGFYNIFISQKQQLDVLFYEESIEIQTRADAFNDSLKVVSSKENMVYYQYLKQQQNLSTEMLYWEELYKRYATQPNKKHITEGISKTVDTLNKQFEYQMLQLGTQHSGLWISKFLHSLYMSGPMRALQNKTVPTDEDKLYYRSHYFDNIDFSDETLIHSRVLVDKFYSYFNFLVPNTSEEHIKAIDAVMEKAKKNEVVYSYALKWLGSAFTTAKKTDIANYLNDNYGVKTKGCDVTTSTPPTVEEKLLRAKANVTGAIAPVLDMPDTTGKTVSLRNLDAPYTVIVFWSSACTDCQASLPKLNEQLQPFLKKDLLVYAVSLDSDKKAWMDFIHKHRLNWTHTCDFQGGNSVGAKTYNVKRVPTFYLLDEYKKILAKNITDTELIQALQERIK